MGRLLDDGTEKKNECEDAVAVVQDTPAFKNLAMEEHALRNAC